MTQFQDEQASPITKQSNRRKYGLLLLLFLPLMCGIIMFAAQAGLDMSQLSEVNRGVDAYETADYGRWASVNFAPVSPRLGTEIALEAQQEAQFQPMMVAVVATQTPASFTGDVDADGNPIDSDGDGIPDANNAGSGNGTNPDNANSTQIAQLSTGTITPSSTGSVTATFTPSSTGSITATLTPSSTGSVTASFTPNSATETNQALTQAPTLTNTTTLFLTNTPLPSLTSNAPPVANFGVSVSSGNAPLLVNFTNFSSGIITTYSWSFGDGFGTSNQPSPSYVFNSPGAYVVTLTVTGPGGTSQAGTTITVMSTAPTAPPIVIPAETATPTLTFTPTLTMVPTNVLACPAVGEPDIGAPDGAYCAIPGQMVIDLDTSAILTQAGYDFVFYERQTGSSGIVSMDTVNIEVATSAGGPWSSVFNWGNGVADANSSLGAAGYGSLGEPDDEPIPMGLPQFYGNAPYQTGIAIDVDPIVGAGVFRYMRLTGISQFDAIQVLSVAGAYTDLGVTQTVSDNTPFETNAITYTVTVTNNGPNDATGIVINYPLPTEFTYSTHTPSQGTYATGTWSVGNLANGASATLNVTMTVNYGLKGVSVNSTATLSAVVNADINSTNDSATVTVTVANPTEPDINLVDGDQLTLECGEQIVINLSATPIITHAGYDFVWYEMVNGGSGNVQMDPIIVEISNSISGPWYQVFYWGDNLVDSNTTVGAAGYGASETLNFPIAPGAPAFYPPSGIGIDVNGVAPAGTYTWIRGSVPFGDCDNSEIDAIVILPITADVGVSMSVDNNSPAENDEIVYTIIATNNGPDAASNLALTDVIPSGLTYVSASATQGGYSANTWTIGGLGSGASATLSLRVRVDTGVGGMTITNTASVSALTEVDANSGNDSASTNITVAGSSPISLQLTALCSPTPSSFLRWQVSNQNAYSINFTWDYQSGAQSGSGSVPAAVGATPGDVVVNTPATGGSENMRVFVSGIQQDIQTSSGAVCDNDLGLEMVATDYTPQEGEQFSIIVRLLNYGPYDGNAIQVTDLLPATLILNSAVATQGTYTAGTGLWDIGDVPLGGVITLTLTVTPAPGSGGSTISNTANIISAMQPDANGVNNTINVNINVQAVVTGADLGISLGGSPPTFAVSETMDLAYNVTNNGPDNATNVVVTIFLPVEVSFVSSASGCTDAGGIVTCNLGNINSGNNIGGGIVVQGVSPNNPVTFVANVAGSESDPNGANDGATFNVTITP